MSARSLQPRGTRAALNALVASSSIVAGQVYLIIDEGRLAVGLTTTTYETFSKTSEPVRTVNGTAPDGAGNVAVSSLGTNPVVLALVFGS